MIVTDSGFAPDDRDCNWTEVVADEGLPSIEEKAIRIRFDSFADGRGFTIARQLRTMGFTGRLRAAGPLIADQYAMARRAGFDEVEIPDEHALRQNEAQWLARANWQSHDYQSRLGKRV